MLRPSATKPPSLLNPAVDLRKRVGREEALSLVERAALLPARDRYLIEGVFRDGRSIADLAAVYDGDAVPDRTSKALRRRLHRLVERLRSPAFLLVVHQRDRWSRPMARVGTACVIQGKTLREAAGSLGMSVHAVRRHHDAILAMAHGFQMGRRAASRKGAE